LTSNIHGTCGNLKYTNWKTLVSKIRIKEKEKKKKRRLYEMTVHILHASPVISIDPHRKTISSWLKLNGASWYLVALP